MYYSYYQLLTKNNDDVHSVKYTHFKQGKRLIFFSKSYSKSMRQRNNKVTFFIFISEAVVRRRSFK